MWLRYLDLISYNVFFSSVVSFFFGLGAVLHYICTCFEIIVNVYSSWQACSH